MKRGSRWSRRQLCGAALGTAGLLGRPVLAQEVEVGDRGLGGTGVVPSDPAGDDRGIGGTGVVGTIRRFGSIVVNDLRIAFPRTVAVAIDGRPARLRDLRVGHVVHVLAQGSAGHLTTQRIEALSAVVGPVEAATTGGVVVMGQTVVIPKALQRGRLRVGRWVAISGLRRLDGVVVASLVTRHRGTDARIAGIPTRGDDGEIRIGALPLDHLPTEALGQRMLLSGRIVRGRLAIDDARPQWSSVLAERPGMLSIEDYVALDNGRVTLASGLVALGHVVERTAVSEARAVVSATVAVGGQIHVDGVRVQGFSHGSGRAGAPRGSAPDHPQSAGPGGPVHGSAPGRDARGSAQPMSGGSWQNGASSGPRGGFIGASSGGGRGGGHGPNGGHR